MKQRRNYSGLALSVSSCPHTDVTAVTAQVQAASAFVGLRLNTSKTESMDCGVKTPMTLDVAKTKEERDPDVDPDDEVPRDARGRRPKVAFEGWMTEYNMRLISA